MAHAAELGTPLTVGLIVSTYGALLTVIGFAFRALMRGRARELAKVSKLRRRVRKLRGELAQVEVNAAAGPEALRKLQALGESLAVVVSELEALNAWKAAQDVRRAAAGGR